MLDKLEDGIINFIDIPEELIEDKDIRRLIAEYKKKDVSIKPLHNKWKTLSLFPGEHFIYEAGVKISGEDANSVIKSFSERAGLRFEVKTFYRGVLPKVGRHYYTTFKALLIENGELFPYYTVSY